MFQKDGRRKEEEEEGPISGRRVRAKKNFGVFQAHTSQAHAADAIVFMRAAGQTSSHPPVVRGGLGNPETWGKARGELLILLIPHMRNVIIRNED